MIERELVYQMEIRKREYVEILEILKYIQPENYLKIPKEKLDFFEQHKELNYEFNFDKSKPILEQNVSKKTYIIFLKIYLDYIANENEKKTIKEVLRLNALKNDEEKRKRYSNEIFKNKNLSMDLNNNQLQVIEKKGFIYKITSFIKKILLKK